MDISNTDMHTETQKSSNGRGMQYHFSKGEILEDYRIANVSRELSLIGRREVLNGRAKFGIFGDGKEVAQLAMAKFFREGDFRSGYYRDQTFQMAAGMLTAEQFFAQLYGDTDLNHNPDNGGRLMNNHFATRSLDENGEWKDLTSMKNSSADISPTAGQMPRLLGLAQASRLYREIPELRSTKGFSNNGNEVAFGTIGDSSTSEGQFFETINAAGVLQVPMAMSVWDDGYGISVTRDHQTTKGNISEALKGFRKEGDSNGYYFYSCKGWDYPALVEMYREGIDKCRKEHVPVLFHVTELTQPQGHSTSGSHERYKSKERLQWEKDNDPISRMREWIIHQQYATAEELDDIEHNAKKQARNAKKTAWKNITDPVKGERDELLDLIDQKNCICSNEKFDKVTAIRKELKKIKYPIRKDNFSAAKKILRYICYDCPARDALREDLSRWIRKMYAENKDRYSSHLYSETPYAAVSIEPVPASYSEDAPEVAGREILRDNFDKLFEQYPHVVIFGEDTGKIGGVNQSMEGLQQKYGEMRVADTGIREITIAGQAIGLAMRGIRPIAEIQYFDYLLYALQTLSDDLATLHYRTKGGQKAPAIIRTRGHRLEGVWHSGSPLSMVINSLRGMIVAVPRNMTQAAGIYNTLIQADDPALVIEPLNGYRLKEKQPENLGQHKVPVGKAEVLQEGRDVTLVTYGSCVRIAMDAAMQLKEFDIYVEVIDAQTLLPFDRERLIAKSVQKTNRVLFFDEDVPGGATAFMMQKVMEEQNAFFHLDSPPATLTAEQHRPAYSTDGDYFSNPNAEDVFDKVYDILREANPHKYAPIYK